VQNGALMFVRRGCSAAIVSQLKLFSLAKLGKLARSAVRKFGPHPLSSPPHLADGQLVRRRCGSWAQAAVAWRLVPPPPNPSEV
jgi:hypothetical protein